jgi:hypothetical protein
LPGQSEVPSARKRWDKPLPRGSPKNGLLKFTPQTISEIEAAVSICVVLVDAKYDKTTRTVSE